MSRTFYLDLESGNDALDGTTFANRWKTFVSGATSSRIANGDTVRIKQSPTPTSTGVNGTWTNSSATVVLASAVNKTVDNCDALWTASTNVVSSLDTTNRKNGTGSNLFAIASGFTTGKIAFSALGSAQSFAAYQQVNFWIKTDVLIAANTLRLDLCSDVSGATPVNSVTVNVALQAATWYGLVFNTAGNLGASIQSVALVALLDPGVVNVNLDIIFASKSTASADCITINSLISKGNTGGTEVGDTHWWKVQSVDGVNVSLDAGNSQLVGGTSPPRGYYGVTETVPVFVRQTTMVTEAATLTGTVNQPTKNGSYPTGGVTYSGGWNSTDMSTQVGDTFFGVNNGFGRMLDGSAGLSYVTITNMHAVGGATGFYIGLSFTTLIDCGVYSCDLYAYEMSLSVITLVGHSFTRCVATHCGSGFTGGLRSNFYPGRFTFDSCSVVSSSLLGVDNGIGFLLFSPNSRLTNCVSNNNHSYGYTFYAPTQDADAMYNCSGINNSSGDIYTESSSLNMSIRKCVFATLNRNNQYGDSIMWSHDTQGVVGTHKGYIDNGDITSNTVTRHTASGLSWKINISGNTRTSFSPIKFKILEVALLANVSTTISVWVNRDTTASTAQLVVPKYQITGVDTDVTVSSVAAINTWEQLTVTFTPTEAGVVSAWVYFNFTGTFSSALACYVDDVTVSQP